MVIEVFQGQETIVMNLSGKGVEQKLKITNSIIKFNPFYPNTLADEATIIVENRGARPVEFYWRHLEK